MHELLDVKPWPRVMLRYPLLILTALLLGAALSFAYSYAPLHRANVWKIGYLEERLESRNEQVNELEAQLEQAKSSLDGTPSNEEVRALRTRLDEAIKLAESREKEIGGLERKLASMTRSRDSWKGRHAEAVAKLEAPAPAPVAVVAPEASDAPEADAEPTAPASPAPAAPDAGSSTTPDITDEE